MVSVMFSGLFTSLVNDAGKPFLSKMPGAVKMLADRIVTPCSKLWFDIDCVLTFKCQQLQPWMHIHSAD
jgi:hypothetical protein